MPVASPIGEVVHAALRKMNIAAQAVVLRVDAAMIQFDVYAQLVSNNTDFLQRRHFLEQVFFTDGTTGDNGLVFLGSFPMPDEAVVFTDGTLGDNGLVIWIPLTVDGALEAVTFTEIGYSQGWAIHDDEFVTFADFGVSYLLDFLRDEQVIYSDISIAWEGEFALPEAVNLNDSLTVFGGNNTVSWSESVNISETLSGANSFIFGDAVTMFEFWDTGLAFPTIGETVTWTDKLVVSVVAATDSRPGAFVPGSALLGSPT